MPRRSIRAARPLLLPLLALPVMVVGLIGVGGAAPEQDAATATPGAGDGSVAIVDFTFAPSEVRITPGTEVVWTNKDGSAHSVKDGNGLFDESAALATGEAFRFVYDKPGTYPYVCGIHTYMTGEVTVAS